MQSYLEIKEADLRRLYEEEHLTQRQIAKLHNCNERTIRKAMRRYGINARLQKKERIERNCQQCGKITTNPKFCTSSCAAIFNNTHFPKRTAERLRKQKYCERCGKPTRYRRKFCIECKPDVMKWLDKTIAELRTDDYGQTYRIIRLVARKIYADSGLPRACVKCGYELHIEVCHIKPIKSFPKEARIAQVNAIENLVALCPNHHWEFDNGLIDLK